ncbi:vitamin B12-dependent ribonucleotide reductase, partial [Candidatus Poribacteria bacterium]|nr:vitamin B12-dependent ribonucleotide reductase [Candidatus Poribacteria bacterium]
EDILDVYVEAWRLGLKAIAVYRDGSKISQPLSASADEVEEAAAANEPVRRRLPDERQSVTHKFSVGEHEGYITVGLYEDGKPGEMFLTMSKEGSTISGLMDAFATMTSLALQYGVPLDALVRKFSHMRFEPQGFTSNKQIPMAKSLVDYIFRWMALKFLDDASLAGSAAAYYANADDAAPAIPAGGPVRAKVSGLTDALAAASSEPSAVATQTGGGDAEHTDGVACHVCGTIMLRSGTCYVCPNCGGNTGCG